MKPFTYSWQLGDYQCLHDFQGSVKGYGTLSALFKAKMQTINPPSCSLEVSPPQGTPNPLCNLIVLFDYVGYRPQQKTKCLGAWLVFFFLLELSSVA